MKGVLHILQLLWCRLALTLRVFQDVINTSIDHLSSMTYKHKEILDYRPQNTGTNISGDDAYFAFQICGTLRTTAIDMILKKFPQNSHKN
jgi:hypothetical protein